MTEETTKTSAEPSVAAPSSAEAETKAPLAEAVAEVKVEETKTEEAVAEAAAPEVTAKEEKKVERIPELKPGMTIKVYQKIKELNTKGEEKERVQFFEGMIIAMKHGNEAGATMTVYKESNGVGVEKIYPLNLPTIEKIEIKKQAQVRRAKLYYLKEGYKKKLKEKVLVK